MPFEIAQVAVGNAKWSRISSAIKTGFAKFPGCSFEDLPAAPSSVDSPFEPDSTKIVHVLLNPIKNPEDIGLPAVTVDTAALGELRNFILRLRRVLKTRQAPAITPFLPTPATLAAASTQRPLLPNNLPVRPSAGSGTAPSEGPARLSLADIAEHPRLWWFCPADVEDHWIAAAASRFRRLLDSADNVRDRGLAVDAILALPAQCFVRTRGGRRRTASALKTRLHTVATTHEAKVPGYLPGRTSPGVSFALGQAPAHSELETWKAKV